MGGRFKISNTGYEPGGGNGRLVLIAVLLLIIATIIFVTKNAPSQSDPHPRPTARGQ